MKTTRIMERTFNGKAITQNHRTEMFNAQSMLAMVDDPSKRLGNFMALDSVEDLIEQISYEENKEREEVVKTTRGKNGGTWLHPVLAVKLAAWLSPKFEYWMLKCVVDGLLSSRDASGDSYIKMSSAIKKDFPKYATDSFVYMRVANQVAEACGVYGKAKWDTANERQLKLRDKIHELFVVLAPMSTDPYDCVAKATKAARGLLQ